MRLNKVFARFYKSFNFDDRRKAQGGSRHAWEMIDEDWYPFVEVSIEGGITAVVGANESGKSQLLGAIKVATFSAPLLARDICRYSDFFGVEAGKQFWPQVGAEWTELTTEEQKAVGEIVGGAPKSMRIFRFSPERVQVWIGQTSHDLEEGQIDRLQALLPKPLSINPEIALPATIPLRWLTTQAPLPPKFEQRSERAALFDVAAALRDLPDLTSENLASHAPLLLPILESLVSRHGSAKISADQRDLVEDLLYKLSNVDEGVFDQLAEAIRRSDEGLVKGLVEKLNQRIETGLNLRRWWVQDREFSLRLSVSEFDLSFTIRDRTGTEYAFDERSHGLRFFLSYLIQSQSIRAQAGSFLLLMDEPDAHLSAEAQQDLLRIFDDLVDPARPGRAPMQVIYVTHSPFLLDKNHAERIRVLEKGHNLDGTRVIERAGHNHYEPLRSAFGAFVGETAFIGSVNLVVEGPADQILMAAAARGARRLNPGVKNETLDLNRMVIVPASGASQIPYMVYLIRGRDAHRPPVIALFDSDKEGDDNAAVLRNDPHFKDLIEPDLVIQVGDVDQGLQKKPEELEDLLPLELAIEAANRCLAEMLAFRGDAPPRITNTDVESAPAGSVFEKLDYAVRAHKKSLGKVALAKAVADLVGSDSPALAADIKTWLERMSRLFVLINARRRLAEERNARSLNTRHVENRVKMFEADHPDIATCEEIDHLLESIFIQLDGSREADAIRQIGNEIRLGERLRENPSAPVADLAGLLNRLRALRYAPETIRDRLKADARRANTREERSKESRTRSRTKPIAKAAPKPEARPADRRQRRADAGKAATDKPVDEA